MNGDAITYDELVLLTLFACCQRHGNSGRLSSWQIRRFLDPYVEEVDIVQILKSLRAHADADNVSLVDAHWIPPQYALTVVGFSLARSVYLEREELGRKIVRLITLP